MKRLVYLSVCMIGILIACKKEESAPAIQPQTFEINSTGTATWKYFSFAKNDTISVSDPAASSEWDLAFQRYRIRTNGGRSGHSIGGAANSYKKGQTGFDALNLVPDTANFATDDSVKIAVQYGYATYIVNPVLYTWFSIELAAQGTQIVPSDYVYIVETGTGKFAKVWFKSYYSATNEGGHITFQYKYQPDGSKRLE
jgi:hypothetical protein